MFCHSCGKPVPPDSQFCPACGQSVVASAPGGTAAPSAPPAAPTGAAQPAFDPAPASVLTGGTSRSFWARVKGMKTWKKVVLGIVIFIVLVIALALFATSGLDKPVQRHFAALHSGDVVGAYSELSVAARQQTSLDDFKAMLTNTPALNHVTGESYTSRELNNGQGQLEGTLDLEGGGKLPISITVVKENDQWKILSYHVTPVKSQ